MFSNKSEKGQGCIEYVLMVFIVALVVYGAWMAIGGATILALGSGWQETLAGAAALVR
jgi:hypothetical protein